MTQADQLAPGRALAEDAVEAAGPDFAWPGRSLSNLPLAISLLGTALLMLAASILAPSLWAQLALIVLASLLAVAALVMAMSSIQRRSTAWAVRRAVAAVLRHEESAAFVTDLDGAILARNDVAALKGAGLHLAEVMARQMADAGAVVQRLGARACISGSAEWTIGTRQGPVRLSAQRVEQDSLLWRLQSPTDRDAAETAAPLLRVGPEGAILSTNAAFRRLLGPAPRQVDSLLLDPPLRPGHMHRIASPSGTLQRLVVESGSANQSQELLLLPPVAAAPAPSGEVWDAVEDLPVPLLKLSPAGVVLASNRHARSLLPAESGARLSDLLEGLGRPICEWVADVAAGRPAPGPQVLRGSGDRQDTVLRVALNRAGGPDDAHLIAVLDDVSEFKALEAQFVQSQKMQALGQLAGGVAHDFNNLLTAISGHCDLLLLRQDEQDPEYGDLIQIRHNVNRAASLVGQLLAFSRKQSMMPETLDLRVALADLTHLLNRLVGEKVSLHLDHDPSLDHVRADKRQLEQVIMNLVVNARDAMPDGGEILIQTENRHLSEALPCGRAMIPPGRYVLVRVIDQGTGIPPDRLPKIFEPFYTTKKLGEGTGLGLSTAYGIVKQSGGYIFAESEVGRGTVFTLWFPAHGKPVPKASSVARPQAAFREVQGVVLLVEDEAPVRAFAVRALRMRGYIVLEADSGEGALELLDGLETPVDLIVTDVILPGKDGPTWVREAVETRPETRVIFVSGYAEDAFGEQKALIPGSVFLPKPFSLGELTALVERQLTWGRADVSDVSPVPGSSPPSD